MFGTLIRGVFVGVLVAAVVAAAAIALFFFYFGSNVYEWRQKISVVVETPTGEVTGWSVQAVSAEMARHRLGMDGGSYAIRIHGEAVVVSLPSERTLFLLIKGARGILPRLLWPRGGWASHEVFGKSAALPVGTNFTVPPELYPLLVTFADVTDPTSIMIVDPANLAATFGSGYRLVAVTLELTDEPTTIGRVERVLTWLGRLEIGFVPNGTTCSGPPLRLHDRDFRAARQ